MNFKNKTIGIFAAVVMMLAIAPDVRAEEAAAPAPMAAVVSNKVAVIDLSRVARESLAGKDLDKKVKAARDALKAEGEGAEKALREKEAALIKELKALDPKKGEDRKIGETKKKAFESEIQKKRQGFIQKGSDLKNAEIESMKSMQGSIALVAAKVAEQKKIDIVLDRQAVLIAVQGLDISAEVIKGLDATVKSVPFKAGK